MIERTSHLHVVHFSSVLSHCSPSWCRFPFTSQWRCARRFLLKRAKLEKFHIHTERNSVLVAIIITDFSVNKQTFIPLRSWSTARGITAIHPRVQVDFRNILAADVLLRRISRIEENVSLKKIIETTTIKRRAMIKRSEINRTYKVKAEFDVQCKDWSSILFIYSMTYFVSCPRWCVNKKLLKSYVSLSFK